MSIETALGRRGSSESALLCHYFTPVIQTVLVGDWNGNLVWCIAKITPNVPAPHQGVGFLWVEANHLPIPPAIIRLLRAGCGVAGYGSMVRHVTPPRQYSVQYYSNAIDSQIITKANKYFDDNYSGFLYFLLIHGGVGSVARKFAELFQKSEHERVCPNCGSVLEKWFTSQDKAKTSS